ncbi:pre-rRNA-processing protein pno1, partial [Coemansia sp. S85]
MASVVDNQQLQPTHNTAMDEDDEVLITADQLNSVVALASTPAAEGAAKSDKPDFAPLSAKDLQTKRNEIRRIRVPPHRFSPLKADWLKIYSPIV